MSNVISFDMGGESAIKTQGQNFWNYRRTWYDQEKGKFFVYHFKGGDPSDMKNYAKMEVYRQPVLINGTLRYDEWKYLDNALIRNVENELVGVQDLKDAGVEVTLDGMRFTEVQSETISTDVNPIYTMDPVQRALADRPIYDKVSVPLPFLVGDFFFNSRDIEVSRNKGMTISDEMMAEVGRQMGETLEKSLMQETSAIFEDTGGKVHSYISWARTLAASSSKNIHIMSLGGTAQPKVKGGGKALDGSEIPSASFAATNAWDAKTGSDAAVKIVNDVLAFKELAKINKSRGPWRLYIPTTYDAVLDQDYKDTTSGTTSKTIRQRILEIEGVEAIRPSWFIPDDTIIFVQITSRTVRWLNGMDVRSIEWAEQGNLIYFYKGMTIQIPEFRKTAEGQSDVFIGYGGASNPY